MNLDARIYNADAHNLAAFRKARDVSFYPCLTFDE